MPILVLASASPRRLELLRQIGIVPDHVEPADIDEDGIETRGAPHHPAEMDAAGRRGVAALDIELDCGARLDPGDAPLAGAGADQQVAGQARRYPRPARSCAVSYNGSPTTFE